MEGRLDSSLNDGSSRNCLDLSIRSNASNMGVGDLFPVLGIAIKDARLPVLGAYSLFPVLGMAINDALLPVLGMAINDALLPVLGKASIAALLPVRGNGIIEALLPVLGKGINACRFDRFLDLLPAKFTFASFSIL